MKVVCDSSSIIALSMNCLLWILNKFEAEFIIPPYVRKEIFDAPINNPRYAFEAMRNALLLGTKIKVVETDLKLRDRIIELANSLYHSEGRNITIIHYGEADVLALARKEDIETILVDEKNTRLLIEDREMLKRSLENRMKRKIEINEEAEKAIGKILDGLRVIRSSELVAVAVKRGYFDWPYNRRDLLRSALYALKFSGCAISDAEIIELINLVAPVKFREV